MEVSANPSLIDAIESIRRATNHHDLDALVACFAPDYQSEFPVHPDRAFHGLEQLRRNWGMIFGAVPNIHAELLRYATEGDYRLGRVGMDGSTCFGQAVPAPRRDHSGS